MLLQARVPGLLHRHHPITEGFLASPQNLIRDQVETFKGFPQQVLLHSVLLTQDIQHMSAHDLNCAETDDTTSGLTDLWNPHLLRQGEVVCCESVVQKRHSELQSEK